MQKDTSDKQVTSNQVKTICVDTFRKVVIIAIGGKIGNSLLSAAALSRNRSGLSHTPTTNIVQVPWQRKQSTVRPRNGQEANHG